MIIRENCDGKLMKKWRADDFFRANMHVRL